MRSEDAMNPMITQQQVGTRRAEIEASTRVWRLTHAARRAREKGSNSGRGQPRNNRRLDRT